MAEPQGLCRLQLIHPAAVMSERVWLGPRPALSRRIHQLKRYLHRHLRWHCSLRYVRFNSNVRLVILDTHCWSAASGFLWEGPVNERVRQWFLDMEAEIEIECCIIQLTGWRGAWLGVSRFATPLLYNWVLVNKPHTGRCNW